MSTHRASFRPRDSLLILTIVLALAIGTTWADALLQVTVGGDSVALPRKVGAKEGCRACVPPPEPGDIVTVYMAGNRIRRDRGSLSVILDQGKRKVEFVCRETRQYSEFDYPVKYAKVLASDYRKSLGDLVDFQPTAPVETHSGQVKDWKVETFEATVANGLREQYRVHVAVADAIPGADGPLLEFRKLLHELEHSGHGWSQFLPFTTGMPIVWEEREHQPETEFVYREEVTKIEVREIPAETFEVPKGYAEIKYDPACFSAR